MERKKIVIVTAGGSGTRMGGPLPKQFIPLNGVPVLRRTIGKFLEAAPDTSVILTLPEAWIPEWKQYCLKEGFNCRQRLVPGGFTRFHSVKNALAAVPDGALVAIHDGVRPLLSPAWLRSLWEKAGAVPALIPVLPSTDSLKVLDRDGDGQLRQSDTVLDRSRIYAAQTPQIFHSELLKAAYGQPYSPLFTDDASVAAAYGIPLSFAEGYRYNLKITTPEDMDIAGALLDFTVD